MFIPIAAALGTVASLTTWTNVNHEEELERLVEEEEEEGRGEDEKGEEEGTRQGERREERGERGEGGGRREEALYLILPSGR